MKKKLGVVFIILGIITIAYTGFNFVTAKKIVDLGPVEISQEENHPVKWSLIVGGMLLIGGIVLIVLNKNVNRYPLNT